MTEYKILDIRIFFIFSFIPSKNNFVFFYELKWNFITLHRVRCGEFIGAGR